MNKNNTSFLEIFFNISKETINNDLLNYKDRSIELITELTSLLTIDHQKLTPEQNAKMRHLSMIQANFTYQLDNIDEELKVFHIATSIEGIISEVRFSASSKGELASLSDSMDKIQLREGLTSDEFWHIGQGPSDYEMLNNEYNNILYKIEDTVISHTLKRYYIFDLARLFDSDSTEFEIQREIGRRVCNPTDDTNKEVEAMLDKHFRNKFGAKTFDRITSRVLEIQAKHSLSL